MKAMLHQLSYGGRKSCQPELNRQPAPYEGTALPVEPMTASELPTGIEPATSALQERLSFRIFNGRGSIPMETAPFQMTSELTKLPPLAVVSSSP